MRQMKLVSIGTLTVVIAVGLVLRLYGIKWGLPNASHPIYSYHPDEALHLFAADWLATGHMIPKHFMYGGTFYFAILNAISYFAEHLQHVLGGFNLLADTILLGRYLMTASALANIYLVYRCGRDMYGQPVGIVAALLLAITPAHIVSAQTLRPDELSALIVTMLLLIATRILHEDSGHGVRNFVYSGLITGAATALRFPLIIFILIPFVAFWQTSRATDLRSKLRLLLDRKILLMSGAVVIGYALASPQSFMFPSLFYQGLEVQWRYQSEPFVDAVGMGPGIFQYGWLMLHQSLGYGIYALAMFGLLYAFLKRTAADWILLAAVVPYLILTSFTSWVVVRYTLPIVPPLVLFAARAVLHGAGRWSSVPGRVIRHVGLGLIILWTMSADLAYLRLETSPNVRQLASQWIIKNIAPGSSIIVVKTYVEDDFFNPVIPSQYRRSVFFLNDHTDGSQIFREKRQDYLVLNEYIYKNMERLGDSYPSLQARRFYHGLTSGSYRLLVQFKQPVSFLGMDFSGWFAANDYGFVNPGIRIYRRVQP